MGGRGVGESRRTPALEAAQASSAAAAVLLACQDNYAEADSASSPARGPYLVRHVAFPLRTVWMIEITNVWVSKRTGIHYLRGPNLAVRGKFMGDWRPRGD